MTLPYVSLKAIQFLFKTFFSKIKNEKIIWGGPLKWDTLYIDFFKNVSRSYIWRL